MGQTFTSSDTTAGVTAINNNTTQQAGPGVHGKSAAAGVWGESTTWHGVVGLSTSSTGGAGVMGGAVGPGVIGTSETWHGTYGESKSTTGGVGAWGEHKAGGTGVQGHSTSGRGVAGFSDSGQGVYGHSASQAGVVGESDNFDGVFGISHNVAHAGVSGHNPGGLAGFFEGNVSVTGNITVSGDILLPGADCAEQFEVTGSVGDAGTVMVFDDSERLSACTEPYDRRVAGVVSGADRHRPGLILNSGEPADNSRPIALIGRVYCKVDASYGAIEAGDLLTTSPNPGHAMKAAEQSKAFGATLGKALRAVREGQDLIPILVALQ